MPVPPGEPIRVQLNGALPSRCDTTSTIAPSSGKVPVLSFEYTRSPSRDTSKHPPPAGISFSSLIFCLYWVRSLAARLTALGS